MQSNVKKNSTLPQPQQQQINLDEMATEQLTLLLQEQYKATMEAQQNIWAINRVIQFRIQQAGAKPAGSTDNEGDKSGKTSVPGK